MSGRGAHEKAFGERKTGFAFNSIPSQGLYANSAWQPLSVLAFNLARALQVSTIALALHLAFSDIWLHATYPE
jgi:hypothetical protein